MQATKKIHKNLPKESYARERIAQSPLSQIRKVAMQNTSSSAISTTK